MLRSSFFPTQDTRFENFFFVFCSPAIFTLLDKCNLSRVTYAGDIQGDSWKKSPNWFELFTFDNLKIQRFKMSLNYESVSQPANHWKLFSTTFMRDHKDIGKSRHLLLALNNKKFVWCRCRGEFSLFSASDKCLGESQVIYKKNWS